MSVTQYQDIGVAQPDGMRIGNATTDLVAFHGSTPVDQYAHIADATDATTALTRINLIIAALEEKGLLASS